MGHVTVYTLEPDGGSCDMDWDKLRNEYEAGLTLGYYWHAALPYSGGEGDRYSKLAQLRKCCRYKLCLTHNIHVELFSPGINVLQI